MFSYLLNTIELHPMNRATTTILLMSFIVCSCNAQTEETGEGTTTHVLKQSDISKNQSDPMKTFSVGSPAFVQGAMIPRNYTCDGTDSSPELSWSDIPSGATSLAIVVEDPDAPSGLWIHWVAYNIPSTRTGMPKGVPVGESIPEGGRQGRNSWGNIGYRGPCPPPGTHRYFFRIFALDTMLDLQGEPTREQLLKAMSGHIVGQCELMGRYSR